MNKKVVRKKEYSIITTHYDDGTVDIVRKNKGYSVSELLGIITVVQNDLVQLFSDGLNKSVKMIRKSDDSPMIRKE